MAEGEGLEPTKPEPLAFTQAASKDSPVVNLALVVEDWGDAGASLALNGKPVTRGEGFRVGHNPNFGASDLVVWIAFESTEAIDVVTALAA